MKMNEFYNLIKDASKYTSKDASRGSICYIKVEHCVSDSTTIISATDGHIAFNYKNTNDTDYTQDYSFLVDGKKFLKLVSKEESKRGMVVKLSGLPSVTGFVYPNIEKGFLSQSLMRGEISPKDLLKIKNVVKTLGHCAPESGLIKWDFSDRKSCKFSVVNRAIPLEANAELLNMYAWITFDRIGFNHKLLSIVLSSVADKESIVEWSTNSNTGPSMFTLNKGSSSLRCIIMPLRIYD